MSSLLDEAMKAEQTPQKAVLINGQVVYVDEDTDVDEFITSSGLPAEGDLEAKPAPWWSEATEAELQDAEQDKMTPESWERLTTLRALREAAGIQYGWEPETHEDVAWLIKRYREAATMLDMYAQDHKSNVAHFEGLKDHIEKRYGHFIEKDAAANLEHGAQFARYQYGRVQFTKSDPAWVLDQQSRAYDAIQEWLAKISPERRKRLGVTEKTVYVYDLERLKSEAERLLTEGKAEVVPGLVKKESKLSWTIQANREGRKDGKRKPRASSAAEGDGEAQGP